MISLCILTKDDPYIFNLIEKFGEVCPCEFEVCIGDNGSSKKLSKKLAETADEYVYIHDKQLFKMGIPWAHNLITSIANTYKIFYVDTDEYVIWMNPEIEDMFDYDYVIPALRLDFFELMQIQHLYENLAGEDYYKILDYFKEDIQAKNLETSTQDRIFNSRYAKFEGLCHSIFHVPPHFRSNQPGAILLHNKTVRESKDKERMDELIYEQYMRQNINPMLSSSEVVLNWGKKIREHNFNNWEEWNKAFK